MDNLRDRPGITSLRSSILLILFSVGPVTAVRAQTDDGDGASRLEPVFVTAERRQQDLQDVPISATILDGRELERRGVYSINDLQQVAPSVAINTYNRSTFVNIRGVGIARSAPISTPGVAYYIDGVLVSNDKFIGLSFFDISAIEVLRGPQGTLTGQNSTGGAIYVRTPAPEFSSAGGFIDQSLGNYGQVRTVAAVNFGGKALALRLSGTHEERDSFTTNIGSAPTEPGDLNMDAVRGNLQFGSQDGPLRVNLRGEYFDSSNDGNAVKRRNDPVTSDPFVIQEDGLSFTEQSGHRLSGEIRYDVHEGVQARGIIAWQDSETRDLTDGDRSATALPVPAGLPANSANTAIYPGRVSLTTTGIETLVAELNLLSQGGSRWQWVVGGFYLSEQIGLELYRDNRNTVDFVQSNSTIESSSSNVSKSIFGQVNFFATDRLEFVLGARHSWDDLSVVRYALPGPGPYPFTSTASSRESTGKTGLLYKFTDSLLYVTASKGYKAGGANLNRNSPNFGPETNLVYELGLKSELLDGQLRLNGDVFYSDYQDIQLSSLFNGLPLTQNAASGEAWGAELEAVARFGPFGANIGVGWLDATFATDACLNDTNNPSPQPVLDALGTPICEVGDDLVLGGSRLPYSPEWTINAGLEYGVDVDWAIITSRIQWSRISRQIVTPFPSALTAVPARNIIDARLTLSIKDRYTVEAYVNNLADQTYIATQIQDSSSATGGYVYGAPRTYGVRLVAKFGE